MNEQDTIFSKELEKLEQQTFGILIFSAFLGVLGILSVLYGAAWMLIQSSI